MPREKTSLDVYTIVPPKKTGGKPYWLRIGSAWVNKDRSLNIRLNALPLDGQLQVRKAKEEDG